jgi:DNA (cytosine-5)-methyltransferase 3A
VVDREKSTALTAGYQQTSPADYFQKSRGQYVFNVNPSGQGSSGRIYPVGETKSPTLTCSAGGSDGQKIYFLSEKELEYMQRKVKDGRTHFDFKHHSDTKNDKSSCVTAAFAKGVPYNVLALRGVHGTGRGKRKEGLTSSPDKAPSMTANSWETNNHLAFSLVDEKVIRSEKHNSVNGLKYFGGIDTGSNWGKDGKTLQRNFSQGNRIYETEGKSPSLSASMGGGASGSALIVEEIEEVLYYRKLTPIECERLQTLPDNYTAGVSNSQRYKMLGNGWTADVIAHILSYYKR